MALSKVLERSTRSVLEAAQFASSPVAQIRESIWSKLLTNMSLSILCLLTAQTARAVRDDPVLQLATLRFGKKGVERSLEDEFVRRVEQADALARGQRAIGVGWGGCWHGRRPPGWVGGRAVPLLATGRKGTGASDPG